MKSTKQETKNLPFNEHDGLVISEDENLILLVSISKDDLLEDMESSFAGTIIYSERKDYAIGAHVIYRKEFFKSYFGTIKLSAIKRDL